MRLILDTAPLVAQREHNHPWREAAKKVLLAEQQLPILSPFTAAETDYLLQERAGRYGNAGFISDLGAGRFEVPQFSEADFAQIDLLNQRFRSLSPGLADLSIVVLAARYRTTRILTFDQRHFRILQPLQGGSFTLLPFDEDIA